MTAVLSPTDLMKIGLNRRRPFLPQVMLWLDQVVLVTPGLDAASQQLASRIFNVSWHVVNTWRQADAAAGQPVYEQLELGRVAAVMRQYSVVYGRYYTSSLGSGTLSLLPAGANALVNLEGWDPIGTASFDLSATLLALVTSVRVQ